jgi:hypothetical protein
MYGCHLLRECVPLRESIQVVCCFPALSCFGSRTRAIVVCLPAHLLVLPVRSFMADRFPTRSFMADSPADAQPIARYIRGVLSLATPQVRGLFPVFSDCSLICSLMSQN